MMDLMVDQDGMIHRAKLKELGLQAELVLVNDAEGEQLWPPQEVLGSP